MFILNERRVQKLAQQTGTLQWSVDLCKEYTSSSVKQVSDVFSVDHGDSNTELAVGVHIASSCICALLCAVDQSVFAKSLIWLLSEGFL